MNSKPWFQSKVLWLNIIVMVAAVVEFLLEQQGLGLLPFSLDGKWLAFILAASNFGLRLATNAGVTK